MTITTRFAPSPTGYLHVGGARTALFHGFMRVNTAENLFYGLEDTDLERSTQESLMPFLKNDMAGLDYDAGFLSNPSF